MGRFDALTQLEKKPVLPPSVAEKITASDQFASKRANQQTSKEANQQGSKPANTQTSKEANKQATIRANQQASKTLKKFGSYLTEESIRGLKRIAFDTDRKDYEILQEAVDAYLQRMK
jgi:ribosomal protein L9